ncbi:hypothetical protein SAMN04488580_10538 [Mycobacterium sp. 283mftsu]|nr:hypothetical protein SAMN04488580_10538 [Mycobacterium sp. 283mftsu]
MAELVALCVQATGGAVLPGLAHRRNREGMAGAARFCTLWARWRPKMLD